MGLMNKISDLFLDEEERNIRIASIRLKLDELNEVKDLYAQQYQDIQKALNDSDFNCKEEVSKSLSNYTKSLAKIKRLEKSLVNELSYLERKTSGEKDTVEAVNIIKSLYRSGKLNLDQYNHAAGVKDEDGAIKYADVIVDTFDGKMLLLKRSTFEDKHQGAWVIPGGHVDQGEEFEVAAKRELLEESGISVEKLMYESGLCSFRKVGVYKDSNAHIEYYNLRIPNIQYVEILLDELETRDYLWVPIGEVRNYEMVFNMRDNIIKIMHWDDYPEVKIIRKAIEEGIIPADKVAGITKRLGEYVSVNIESEDFSKSLEEQYVLGEITEEQYDIQKAKKDISKLKKIKKLVYKDGKTYLQTYYVKTGEREEGEVEEKYMSKITYYQGVVLNNVEMGKRYTIKTKIKTTTGDLVDIVYDKQSDSYFLVLATDEGKLVWAKFDAIEAIGEVKLDEETKVDKYGYTFVKKLGGSTGAELVKDSDGILWVAKRGDSKAHAKSEYEALLWYNSCGIKVPENYLEDGVLYTKYIEDATTLGENLENEEILNKVRSGFIVDCLLGNWDVCGMGYDNILCNKFGSSIRVDVGGSMEYRAQGQKKGVWDERVLEIDTMRDSNINLTAARIFSKLTDKDLYDQLQKIGAYKFADNEILHKRYNWLKEELEKRYSKSLKSTFEEIKVDKLYDIPDYLPDNIKKFYEFLNDFMQVKEEDIVNAVNEIDIYSVSKLLDEKEAKDYNNGSINDGVLEDLRKMGLSDREIYAINRYTTGNYGDINEALGKVTSDKSGNLAFKDSGVMIATNYKESNVETEGGVKNSVKVEFQNMLDNFVQVSKSINYHHESGDINYNSNKIGLFNKDYGLLEQLADGKTFGSKELTPVEKAAVATLFQMADNIKSVINKGKTGKNLKNKKVLYLDSSLAEINNIPTYVEQPKVKEVNFVEDKKVSGKVRVDLLNAKLVTSGLTKIECSGNKNYLHTGQTLRWITVGEEFEKQHQFGNLVSHCRASSSKRGPNSSWGGNTELIIIGGQSAYIDSFSTHKGEEEVLHKPFTLFECGTPFEVHGVRKYILRKVI